MKKKTKIIGLIMCLYMLVLYSGCSGQGSDQSKSPLTASVAESPIEIPTLAFSTPTLRPSCLTLIEPEGNTVCGYVISDRNNSAPITNRPVFLARARFLSDGSAVFAELDRSTAPQGILDENGMFYVKNVRPDLYFLMLDDYPQPVILKEPDNPTNDIIVDWRESGGSVDLEVITSYIYVTPVP